MTHGVSISKNSVFYKSVQQLIFDLKLVQDLIISLRVHTKDKLTEADIKFKR